MNEQNLYFLLKDKYQWSQNRITEYLTRTCDTNSCQTVQLTANEKYDIELLKKGIPLDYIIGYVEFLGYHIDLSYKPLIPRTETEYWVNVETKWIIESTHTKSTRNTRLKVLDVFSGSGCIGIAVYKKLKLAGINSFVTF